MASSYEMGKDGIDGVDTLAGCLGTPGLEGYPGVVGSPGNVAFKLGKQKVCHVKSPITYIETARFPSAHCSGSELVHLDKSCCHIPPSDPHHHQDLST